MQGIYIHIPFCAAKCAYCDFLSFADCQADIEAYMTALHSELRLYAKLYAHAAVPTIFFGGGTPTLVPAELLVSTLQLVKSLFDVAEDAEITLEANPETVNLDLLSTLRKAGFNRISFGVQAFDDFLLRRIGRIHTAETAAFAVSLAREAGFTNVNLDLMFSLPDQSLADWEATLDRAIALNPEHLSCYSLILEDGTPLAKEIDLVLPDEDTDRAMYALAKERLAQAGYAQYEISNFAKGGYHSRHNCIYWTGVDYIGAGLGAHSLLDERRLCNTDDLKQYISGNCGVEVLETLTPLERRAEFMVLGLRMTQGISEADFHTNFGRTLDAIYGEAVAEMVRDGLLVRENGYLRLTDRGVDISNRVFARFL